MAVGYCCWHHGPMGWSEAAEAIVSRRVELGMRSRRKFAEATGLTVKTLGELERVERTTFERSTLAAVEHALKWSPGTIQGLVDSSPATPAHPAESWLSTREGIARHVHRDDLPLVELLYRSGLTDSAEFQLILHIRAAREAEQRRLLEDVAQQIRDGGGWAPERAYPPLWLVEDGPGPG